MGTRGEKTRADVLAVLRQQDAPLSAYDILGELPGSYPKMAPPTVYRALDFLLENGLVHRIASLNAFIGCNHPEHPHQGQFLICRNCHTAIELEQPAISEAIDQAARSVGFQVEGQTVEVVGLCASCRNAA